MTAQEADKLLDSWEKSPEPSNTTAVPPASSPVQLLQPVSAPVLAPSVSLSPADAVEQAFQSGQIRDGGVNQPSQFSSGVPLGINPAYNPDWDFTRALTAPRTGIPSRINQALGYVGNVAKAIPADVAETIAGNEKYWELKNLAGAALGEEPQITQKIAESSSESPVAATIAKVGQGLAASAPLLATESLPAAAQKLAALGFSAQMISGAGKAATELGTELGKEPQNRDMDKLTSAISDLSQTALFAPLAAKFGALDAVEGAVRPKDFVIRKLSQQLKNAPQIKYEAPQQNVQVIPKSTTQSEFDQPLPQTQPAFNQKTVINRNRQQPVVPETPAEPYETAVDEIRRKGAKTINEIKAIFPLAELNREQARSLRDLAWGKQEPTTTKANEQIQPTSKQTVTPEGSDQPQSPGGVYRQGEIRQEGDGGEIGSGTPPPQPASPASRSRSAGAAHEPQPNAVAPVEFKGYQQNVPGQPPIELWNVKEPFAGLPKGSTVLRQTVEKTGYSLPEIPAEKLPNPSEQIKPPEQASAPAAPVASEAANVATPDFVERASQEESKVHPELPPEVVNQVVHDEIKADPKGYQKEIDKENPPSSSNPQAAKDPWKMTKKQFVKSSQDAERIPSVRGSKSDKAMVTAYEVNHAAAVADAVESGKPIPPEVLADYPELAKQAEAAKPPVKESLTAQKPPIEPPVEQAKGGEQQTFKGMGGAVPSEFEKTTATPTGIKISAIDRQRAERGLEPLEKAATRSFKNEVWKRTLAKIDIDPDAPANLVKELAEKPRPLTDSDVAMLLYREADLSYERAKLTRDIAQAADDAKQFPERADEIAPMRAQALVLSDALDYLEQVIRPSKTETARGLAALRNMVGDNYTLEAMKFRRSSQLGRDLTPEELDQVKQAHDEIAKKQQAYEDYVAQKEAEIAQREVKLALDKIAAEKATGPKYHPKVIEIAEGFAKFMDKKAGDALARIREKAKNLNAGVDPTLIADMAIVGAAKLTRGLVDFAKWADAMRQDIGDWIEPHLQQVYDASQKRFDEEAAQLEKRVGKGPARSAIRKIKDLPLPDQIKVVEGKIGERVKAGQNQDITPLVQKLARLLVQSGVTDRNALIDQVHGFLRQIIPDMTRREAMDAISGYGQFSKLTKDEISVKLRDLKGQMQQVAKLEDMQSGKPPSKTGMERRVPSDEERALIRKVNDMKREFQIPISDPETQLKSDLDALKTRLKNAAHDYQERLKNKDFSTKPKRILQMDKEANRLHFEMMKSKTKWHEAMMKERIANRPTYKKILSFGQEILNTSRAIITSMDFSAVLRQGGFIGFGHPIRSLKSFPAMFKAFGSEAGQHMVNEQIMARKNYPLYVKSKLFLSEHGHKLSQMEEAYMTRWAQHIPLVGASERAYVTFLNKLRADSFDVMADTLSARKELSQAEADAIANYINVATGRGNFGAKDAALTGLNTVFFAPRLVASRFQLLFGQPLYNGSLRTRVMVAKEYARFLGGIGMVYALGTMAGATIGLDPRSSEFGKMRWGNTRVDPLSGLSQTTVLLTRIATGERKTASGNVVPIRGANLPYGASDTSDVVKNFLRSKLSPIIGASLNIATGKDVLGNPVTVQSTAQNLLVPLSLSDILAAEKDQGIPAATAFGLLSIFGFGIQTYSPQKPSSEKGYTFRP